MLSWLKQLLGIDTAAPAASLPGPPSPPGSPSSVTTPTPAVAAAAPLEVRFGLRRPLVGQGGGVAGFELRLPALTARRIGANMDSPTSAAQHAALLIAATTLAAKGRPVLVRLPGALLDKSGVLAAAGSGLMLLISDPAAIAAPTLETLRSRGVMIGVAGPMPESPPRVDFVMLDAGTGGLEALQQSAQRWREALPRIALMGQGFTSLDELEGALRSGLSLASGVLSQGSAPMRQGELGTSACRICELLNHLALDRDTAVIGDAVRGSAALTYGLLRYASGPTIGMGRTVGSVDEAVSVLGRSELYRWMSMQLLLAAEARPASKALEEAALARGRLLELIAKARGDEQPGAHFTLGLLSLIEQLLQVPMAQALAPLRMSDAAREALLERSGPWAERLTLLDLLDAGDAERADALASTLGVSEHMDEWVDAAWRWAADVREGR